MGTARYTPVISTRSPGLASSTSESKTHMDTVCGVSPSGMASGVSCILICCLLAKTHRLWMSGHRAEVLAPGAPQRGLVHAAAIDEGELGVLPAHQALEERHLEIGNTALHRVTIPRTATILSMSDGLRFRMARVSRRLNVRT